MLGIETRGTCRESGRHGPEAGDAMRTDDGIGEGSDVNSGAGQRPTVSECGGGRENGEEIRFFGNCILLCVFFQQVRAFESLRSNFTWQSYLPNLKDPNP
ncbi:hypothetical protein NL676_005759 [Syzygium grande]|nr:hypothetical protein NL676_005759 [Syzygium grande]